MVSHECGRCGADRHALGGRRRQISREVRPMSLLSGKARIASALLELKVNMHCRMRRERLIRPTVVRFAGLIRRGKRRIENNPLNPNHFTQNIDIHRHQRMAECTTSATTPMAKSTASATTNDRGTNNDSNGRSLYRCAITASTASLQPQNTAVASSNHLNSPLCIPAGISIAAPARIPGRK